MRSSLRLWRFLHSVESQAIGPAPSLSYRKASRGHLGPGPRRLRRWRETLIAEGIIQVEEQNGQTVLRATLPNGRGLRLTVKNCAG